MADITDLVQKVLLVPGASSSRIKLLIEQRNGNEGAGFIYLTNK